MNLKDIDITFDFQTDCRKGQDPDSASKTLRSYQQLLWSKPLPNGEMMKLDIEKGFLKWKDMWFGSDSITASFLHLLSKTFPIFLSLKRTIGIGHTLLEERLSFQWFAGA